MFCLFGRLKTASRVITSMVLTPKACNKELPELENMNNELTAKNCAIGGFFGDGEDKTDEE